MMQQVLRRACFLTVELEGLIVLLSRFIPNLTCGHEMRRRVLNCHGVGSFV
jgi:hypothetical protein